MIVAALAGITVIGLGVAAGIAAMAFGGRRSSASGQTPDRAFPVAGDGGDGGVASALWATDAANHGYQSDPGFHTGGTMGQDGGGYHTGGFDGGGADGGGGSD